MPDNGSGTVDLPPNCSEGYVSPDDLHMIIDGLPPGTTIEIDATHLKFFNIAEVPGGLLGGHVEQFQSLMCMDVKGTGELATFQRSLCVPTNCQTHTGPRVLGDPVQSFPTEMFQLQGAAHPGDPDFCDLRVVAGGGFGLPSPGQTTLTQLGDGTYNVDSFFDITYRIDFAGCPGSVLDGLSGSTQGTTRMRTGEPAGGGSTVLPGMDMWHTVQPTTVIFGGDIPPIPADFFGPGSEPFTGEVKLRGVPLDPSESDVDTVVKRLEPAVLPGNGATATIDIQLVALSLKSIEPIQVGDSFFDVFVGVALHNATIPGRMTLLRASDQGGIFHSQLPVSAEIHFVEVGGGPEFVLRGPTLNLVGPPNGHPWTYEPIDGAVPGAGPNFFPVRNPLREQHPGGSVHTVVPGKKVFTLEFSIDIGSDAELSDPNVDGDEGMDPGDVYLSGSPSATPPLFPCGRDGFKDDLGLFLVDPLPDPPDCQDPPATAVPVGTCAACTASCGASSLYVDYFDVDGHDQLDRSLVQWIPRSGLANPIPREFIPSQCIYPPRFLAISFDDDGAAGWPVGDVPVKVASPAGVSSYGTTLGRDEVLSLELAPGAPPVATVSIIGFADERSVHVSLAPNPDVNETDDDDVDSLDVIAGRDACRFYYFSPDHEAHFGLDPGGIYELLAGPSVAKIIDPVAHLGIPAGVDVDAFEFTWFRLAVGTEVLGVVFSVDEDDPCTPTVDESGGMDPKMIFGSMLTGSSFRLLDVPLTDDIDAISIWCQPIETKPRGACCMQAAGASSGCAETTQGDCATQRGRYAGDGTTCADLNNDGIADECAQKCEPLTDGSACNDLPCDSGPLNDPCIGANTNGTVVLPPAECGYVSPADVHLIIDGLPAGTTIELDPIHTGFFRDNVNSGPGGSLGGEIEIFDSVLQMELRGTGVLSGLQRTLQVPIHCETHTAPRTPGDGVQSFLTDMFRLQGELLGDPDFESLSVVAGSGFGLPSPGHTTLTRLGPAGSSFQVDSFFDITYEIEFVGAPGGRLDGHEGTTTGRVRMVTGNPVTEKCKAKCVRYDPNTGQTEVRFCECRESDECHVERDAAGGEPFCVGTCPEGTECNERRSVNPFDGKIDICCDCKPIDDCVPLPDGSGCSDFVCPPDAGAAPAGPNPCEVTDDGSGTVVLPPAGCEYLSPEEVHQIIDGLPVGTTIVLGAIHQEFIVRSTTPGGTLDGNVEQFGSILHLNLQGTGDLLTYARLLTLPVACETHTGPRNPGDAVQTFPTDMVQLQGELFGDPDFCLLRITGGTGNGLPSPGHTTLTRLGPPGSNFAVDSFFDITYRIDFQGCPGGPLAGLGGSTTGTIRMRTGDPAPEKCVPRCMRFNPSTGEKRVVDCDCRQSSECHVATVPGTIFPTCVGACPDGFACIETTTSNADGSIDLCCDCELADPTGACCLPDGSCVDVDRVTCANAGGIYGGDGSACGGVIEACCLPDGSCDFRDTKCCELAQGIPQPGGLCKGQQACCSAGGDCVKADGLCCANVVGGTPGGPNSQCDPLVKCCLPDDICDLLAFPCCLAEGGQPVATTGSCLTETGCCFADNSCRNMDRDCCSSQGGTPLDGTCSGIEGACCLPDGSCQEMDRQCCLEQGGSPRSGPCLPEAACCFDNPNDPSSPLCEKLDPVCCEERGGTPGVAGSDCGDANGNGVSDECEVECEPLPDRSGCFRASCDPLSSGAVGGTTCVVPDTGGTVVLPPAGCDYLSPDDVHQIIDGLPPDTTIELGAAHTQFILRNSGTGGSLGGQFEQFESHLCMNLNGTGELTGFNRFICLPAVCETHTGPRTPGDPVQSFDTDMFACQGQVVGDPDFDLLRIVAGTSFGLPSPGHTTLTRLPGGDFNVDSFFDITYRIDFVGSPGSSLGGMSGSTTGTIRMKTGEPLNDRCLPKCVNFNPANGRVLVNDCECTSPNSCRPVQVSSGPPQCFGECPPGTVCREIVTTRTDGTIDICCDCVSAPTGACCLPDASCIETTFDDCKARSGAYLGDGSTCAGTIEACCLDDGRCLMTDPTCCGALGGTVSPDGPCTAVEACCQSDGSCKLADPLCCRQDGGTPLGPKTQCEGPSKCCLPNGTCEVIERKCCSERGGTPVEATFCQEEQGCCLPDGRCENLDPDCCVAQSGSPHEGACQAVEACCLDGGFACHDLDPNCCLEIGGTPRGPGSACLGDFDKNGIDDVCEEDCEPLPDGSRCRNVTCDAPPSTAPAGNACVVADNGGGTVVLPPPGCEYLSPDDVHRIIDGLPPGTSIELGASHSRFQLQTDAPGGTLGGRREVFGSLLILNVQGTGELLGFNRAIGVDVSCETHTGPRNPGDPVQSFPTDMFRLQGELFGDPDFCVLKVTGGTDNGLPSPGHTTLTRLGPPGSGFAVDSFFDITYRIEFQGCPGSVLQGMGGSTTATIRMGTGDPTTERCIARCVTYDVNTGQLTVKECECRRPNECHVDITPTGTGPQCVGGCPPGMRCDEKRTINADGTIDLCCDCVPEPEGACCVSGPIGPICIETTQGHCLALNGAYAGDNTACHGTIEACCLPDGGCRMVDPTCCEIMGGIPELGGICEGHQACCTPDGFCADVDALCCVNELGGDPAGPNTFCQNPVSCCLPDGSCEDLSPACCLNKGGQVGTAPCSGIEVGCCLPNGECVNIDRSCCQSQGGVPSNTLCTEPEACCLPTDIGGVVGGCRELDPACCEHLGGKPQGPGSFCEDGRCPRACCLPDCECEQLPPQECHELGGRVLPNFLGCDNVDCRQFSDPPHLIHGTGADGETQPCTGLIDPRWESNNGRELNEGISAVVLVFNEPVFSPGGGPVGPADIVVTETGGALPPVVTAVVTGDNVTFKVELSRIITLQQWTTIRADVVNACGVRVRNLGDLGPGSSEPDRLDIGFLPADTNQNRVVEPVDLTRMRQYIVNQNFHNSCEDLYYFDTNRNGFLPEPVDLTRFRALILGAGAATRPWISETIGAQP